jgi:hypothetical protein
MSTAVQYPSLATAPVAVRPSPWSAAGPVGPLPSLNPLRVVVIAACLCGLLLVNKLGGIGTAAFFTVLAVMIVKSPEAAFLALMLAGAGLLSNMAIVPKDVVWTIGRLAILFVCLFRFSIDLGSGRGSLLRQPFYLALLAFVVAATICSVISGYFMRIALLKLLSFTVGITAVLGGTVVLQSRRADLSRWFVAIAGVIVLNGFLAIGLGAGYGRRFMMENMGGAGSLFQGPFYHPNACGPFSALLALMLFTIWLFSSHRGRWICLVFIPPLLYFMWLSRSRTGFLTLVAGTVVVMGLTFMPAARRFIRPRLNMSRSKLIMSAAAIFCALLLIDLGRQGAITKAVTSFLYKYKQYQDADAGVASILATRERLIDRGWQEFLKRPIFGLGFEVSLSPYFIEHATLFSAPIEKGFLPTALLEEVGLFGTVPFVVFLLTLARMLWRRRNAPGLAMFVAYVITNLGEVSIFAMGGPGLFGWMLVAAGILIGEHCFVVQQPRAPLAPVVRG